MVAVIVGSFALLDEGWAGVLISRVMPSPFLLRFRDPVALSDVLVVAILLVPYFYKTKIEIVESS